MVETANTKWLTEEDGTKIAPRTLISCVQDEEGALLSDKLNGLGDGHIKNTDNPHSVTKAQVGLSDADNTSDMNKPVSTAQQAAIDVAAKAGTDAQAAANTAQKAAEAAQSAVTTHVSNKENPHEVTKAQIGLGNVENTADLDKPVSTATKTLVEGHTSNTSNPHQVTKDQVGLGNVENKSSETIRGELTSQNVTDALKYVPAELDENGLVLSSQLPSYVDDVLEFATVEDFPTPGESGKIYVATTRNLSYRWGGSDYVPITSDIALGETSATAYRGDRGKVAYDHSQQTNGNPHKVTKSDVGLDNVDNTSDADKPISTATQAALDDLAEGMDDVLYKANESEEATVDGSVLNYVMESDLGNIVSDLYNNSKTYAVGDYCIKDNQLYNCYTAVTTPEAFDASKWDATTCANEFDLLNSNIEQTSTLANRLYGTNMLYRLGFYECSTGNDAFAFRVHGNGIDADIMERTPILLAIGSQRLESAGAIISVRISNGSYINCSCFGSTTVTATGETVDNSTVITVKLSIDSMWGRVWMLYDRGRIAITDL